MDTLSDYEIFLRNGTSFTLTKVRKINLNPENLLSNLQIIGSDTTDALIYIDVGEIACIVKRNEYPKVDRKNKWWKVWQSKQ